MTFAELLVAVAEVPGIRRVRFMTSHPRDFRADIVARHRRGAGALRSRASARAVGLDARFLRAMQRTYTREEYLEKMATGFARRSRPSASPRISSWVSRRNRSAISRKR